MAAIALTTACATTGSSAELEQLRAELRQARTRAARLEARLIEVEGNKSFAALSGQNAGARTDNLPDLAVVKLRPKREPPPRVDTRVPIVEPSAQDVEVLTTASVSVPAFDADDAADPTVLDQTYEDAVGLLRVGNLEGGVKRLEQFAAEHKSHPKADNALFFAGVGRMGLEDWEGATTVLEQLMARYPAGDAVQDAMLKLADCRVRLKKSSEARSLYAKIVSIYPGTAAATQAEQQLALLKP
ncbi:MAG: tetratricopeptide repeat protein [Myxococcaceae bacterium]